MSFWKLKEPFGKISPIKLPSVFKTKLSLHSFCVCVCVCEREREREREKEGEREKGLKIERLLIP